ncbi:hypothetical protein FS749_008653 [Ceratobasidium sp. UAMH 11750]|nr:hypothetical protein FS749_008653 [Ceratobasidium sp. UAMH 11750]
MSAPAARTMSPRRALPTPPSRPTRDSEHPTQPPGPLLDPPPEMIAALGPPPSTLSPPPGPRPPSFQPGSFLGPNGLVPFQPPAPTASSRASAELGSSERTSEPAHHLKNRLGGLHRPR